MVIDISKIAGADGETLDFSGEVKFEEYEYPVKVKGTVKNYSGQFVLNCDMETVLLAQCARCLKEFKKEISFSMEEVLGSEDCLECLKIVQNTIDITEGVYTLLSLNIAQKFLCKESCKGLCFVCGTNLNESECNCDKDVVDPRFEVIKNLLNKVE